MNKLNEFIKRSKIEWEAIINSKNPVIYLGNASCGIAAGANDVKKVVEETLKKNNISAQIFKVGCIGPCYLEPLLDISMPGEPRISYGNVNEKWAEKIILKHIVEKEIVKHKVLGHFGEEEIENIDKFFDLPMFKKQKRIVLKNCGLIDPENINHYFAMDGYVAFANSLKKKPKEIIEEVLNSELRGRGGAGFPTGRKWKITSGFKEKTKYLICNADEGDPGAFMNRALLEGDPHAILEGMLIAAYAIGASKGYIYIRAEYPLAILRLKKAIKELKKYRLIGENILDSNFSFEFIIKEGAGAFVCGEETALIHSIEGKRGMPRTKPPFPAEKGLFSKPTVINNVETLATIPHIIRNGYKWYKQFGIKGNYGTKTFSLVGKVRRTGLIEVPLGTTLKEIIFDIGGGCVKPFKAVQSGGPSGGCIPEELIDTPISYENLSKIGSIMGSGGLIVLDKDSCIVDIARFFLNFIQQESCGKCTPCRVGTRHMVDILNSICKGEGDIEMIKKLEDLAITVKSTSLCGLGQTAPNPVLTSLKYFRQEYIEHVVNKYCPSLVCRDLIEYFVDPKKCTGCQRCVSVCPTGAITGPRSELHNLDPEKCIKCRACYEICRFDAIAGNAIVIKGGK